MRQCDCFRRRTLESPCFLLLQVVVVLVSLGSVVAAASATTTTSTAAAAFLTESWSRHPSNTKSTSLQQARAWRRGRHPQGGMMLQLDPASNSCQGGDANSYRRVSTTTVESTAAKLVRTNPRTRRRSFLEQATMQTAVVGALLASLLTTTTTSTSTSSAWADDNKYVYRDAEQGFQFAPPQGFSQTAKPLPTHLKEVQFAPTDETVSTSSISGPLPKSYQYGITVDPVRIESLRDFGTPQEVAAKVVSAELNRDGVFVVTLMKDPVEVLQETNRGEQLLGYVLNYKSQGKRGDKRFVCKFFIAQNRLYALTAQCKEDDYDKFKDDMDAAVQSFTVLRQSP